MNATVWRKAGGNLVAACAAAAALALAMGAGAARANDTAATLGAGGLIFLTTPDIEMAREDLYISRAQVRVQYEFINHGQTDETILVAFPMPDIEGSPDFLAAVPTDDPDNIFGFSAAVDGVPVATTLHQYAFANNIDYSDYLRGLGIPLAPHSGPALDAIEALDDATTDALFRRGLVVPLEYDSGAGWETHYFPVWTLKSTYSFEMAFPAGRTVHVEHHYIPSVGGTAGTTFLAPPYEGYDPAADYAEKYCTDSAFLNAVRRTLRDGDPYSAPFVENWLQYIWSTGANWGGPIGQFHLVIDKGDPQDLVSFCWDGEVRRISATAFEMEAADFYPPYGRELEILILDRIP